MAQMDPRAFGPGVLEEAFGPRMNYGGTTPNGSTLVPGGLVEMRAKLGPLGGLRGGLGDSPVVAQDLSSPSPLIVGGALMVMALGGALTGYLSSIGTWRGAGIGASTHVALFSFGTALAGRARLSAAWIAGFTLLGVAGGGAASWLFYKGLSRR